MKISKEVYPHQLVDVSYIKYITLAAGKSGTSAMTRTISENLGPCVHTHGKIEFEKVHTPPGSSYKLDTLFRDIEKYQGELSLFSVYREPLTRILSNCFQFHMLDSANDMNQCFRSLLPDFTSGNLKHLLWCPHEDISHFGHIDIYKTPFEHTKGYTLYKNNNVLIYFFLFSHIKIWGQQLTEIFNKPIALAKSNITTHPVYRPFLKELRLTEKDLFSIYNAMGKDLGYFLNIRTFDEYCSYINTTFRKNHLNSGLLSNP